MVHRNPSQGNQDRQDGEGFPGPGKQHDQWEEKAPEMDGMAGGKGIPHRREPHIVPAIAGKDFIRSKP